MAPELPYPPDCSTCGLPVGMWEKIVTEPTPDVEHTTWLYLAEAGEGPEQIWHLDCVAEEQG